MAKGKLKSLKTCNFTSINSEGTPLTKEKFRELSGYTHLSDEEAEEAVHSIRLLVKILYEFASKQNIICIENQQVVNLEVNHSHPPQQAA
jgi:hypothetical protein